MVSGLKEIVPRGLGEVTSPLIYGVQLRWSSQFPKLNTRVLW